MRSQGVASDEARVTVALSGNPNAGKTTIFNNLTGGRQHVGNWPGVTVEKKEGTARYGSHEFEVVDLPGTYSLTAYSLEEIIVRDFVTLENPDLVVDIVDASNIERNLYLTTQLMELGVHVVVALNMMDVASARGINIDVELLSELLGVPVVPTVGLRNKGTEELKEAIVSTVRGEARFRGVQVNYGKEVEEEIAKLRPVIEQDERVSGEILRNYSSRWLAVKLLEEDEKVEEDVSKYSEPESPFSGSSRRAAITFSRSSARTSRPSSWTTAMVSWPASSARRWKESSRSRSPCQTASTGSLRTASSVFRSSLFSCG